MLKTHLEQVNYVFLDVVITADCLFSSAPRGATALRQKT